MLANFRDSVIILCALEQMLPNGCYRTAIRDSISILGRCRFRTDRRESPIGDDEECFELSNVGQRAFYRSMDW